MVSSAQFDLQIRNAASLAKQVTGTSQPIPSVWLPLWTVDDAEQDEVDDIQVDAGIMIADVFEAEQQERDEESSEHEEGELTVALNDIEPCIVTKWELPVSFYNCHYCYWSFS